MESTNIVICGMPRSGTTLLYCMMKETLLNYEFYSNEKSALEAEEGYCNKSAWDLFLMDEIRKRFNQVIFIVLYRDPRDVLVSRHPRLKGNYFIDWEKDFANRPGVKSFIKAIEYSLTNKQTDTMFIKYEDLIRGPNIIQSRIANQFGLDFYGLFSEYHLTLNGIDEQLVSNMHGIREVDGSNIGNWRSSIEDKDRVINIAKENEILTDFLMKHGYEKNWNWHNC